MNNQTTANIISSAELNSHNNNQTCPACQEKRIDELIARRQSDPEAIALSMKRSAKAGQMLACVLQLIEITGLYSVTTVTFGKGMIGAFCSSVLFVAIIAMLSKLALSQASREIREKLFWGFIAFGGLLAMSGMVGFAILRTSMFTGPLMGGAINFGTVSIGNALFMFGLTMGVPLIIGALYADASEKLYRAEAMLEDIEEQNRAVL